METLFYQNEELVTTKAMKAHKGCLLCPLCDFFAFVVEKLFGSQLWFLEPDKRTTSLISGQWLVTGKLLVTRYCSSVTNQ
jgi:hypothetical protein